MRIRCLAKRPKRRSVRYERISCGRSRRLGQNGTSKVLLLERIRRAAARLPRVQDGAKVTAIELAANRYRVCSRSAVHILDAEVCSIQAVILIVRVRGSISTAIFASGEHEE